jgi:hypothetical protein
MFKAIIFSIVIGLFTSCPAFAFGEDATVRQSMKFLGIPPRQPLDIFGNAWTIFANGNINSHTSAELTRFIETTAQI